MVKGCNICALSVTRASVAGPDGIREERRLKRRAHKRFRRVWQVGGAGRGVREYIAFVKLLATNLFLHFRLESVESQVFPAMLSFELGECEAVL